MDGGSRDSMALCQLSKALAAGAILEDGRAIELQWLPSDVASFELRAAHAGAHSLDDQAAFEFCDCPDDHHNGRALTGRRYRSAPGS